MATATRDIDDIDRDLQRHRRALNIAVANFDGEVAAQASDAIDRLLDERNACSRGD